MGMIDDLVTMFVQAGQQPDGTRPPGYQPYRATPGDPSTYSLRDPTMRAMGGSLVPGGQGLPYMPDVPFAGNNMMRTTQQAMQNDAQNPQALSPGMRSLLERLLQMQQAGKLEGGW